jgi:Ca2+-dependent lipid-binding protein
VFLLPNRRLISCFCHNLIILFSEESRRQSKILYENLNPAWNECFFYYGVSTADLNNRALEITVWDYDQYNGHEFIGETVIDLSQILLDNQHFSYPLVDMDDENPLRLVSFLRF